MSTRMRHAVVLAILILIYPASGVQRPSHKVLGATGGRLGNNSERSGLPRTAAVVSTALRRHVAMGNVARDHHNQHRQPALLRRQAVDGPLRNSIDFVPKGPSQVANAAMLSSGAIGFASNVGMPLNTSSEKSSPVAGAATKGETLPSGSAPAGNLFYVIDGKEMQSWPNGVGNGHSSHQQGGHGIEVGILGSAELARTRTLEKPQVPQRTATPHTSPETSVLDVSTMLVGTTPAVSARFFDKQAPTGMPVGTTPAVVVAPAPAPNMAATAPASAETEAPHRVSLLELIGMLLAASTIAVAVAVWFLLKPRGRQEASDSLSSDASPQEQKHKKTFSSRRSSRRASALMAQGLISAHEVRESREPLNLKPSRDRRNSASRSPRPSVQASPRPSVQASPRPSVQASPRNSPRGSRRMSYDFAPSMSKSNTGGSADAASGTWSGTSSVPLWSVRGSDPTQRLSVISPPSTITMHVPDNVQDKNSGSDSSDSEQSSDHEQNAKEQPQWPAGATLTPTAQSAPEAADVAAGAGMPSPKPQAAASDSSSRDVRLQGSGSSERGRPRGSTSSQRRSSPKSKNNGEDDEVEFTI